MKYTCNCKKEYEPDHYYMNGNSTMRGYAKFRFTATVGSSFNLELRLGEYTLISDDGVYKMSMTRECFREYFTIKSFMRNRKLEELGII